MSSSNRHTIPGDQPRVMLVPDTMSWILGTWAREIVRWNSLRYDFIVFPFGEIRQNEQLFRSLLSEIDVVHCLSQTAYPAMQKIVRRLEVKRPVMISTIHHIVKLEQVKECLEADRIMVVCRQVLQDLINRQIPEKKLFLYYNGVDTKIFTPNDRLQAKKKFGIEPGSFNIGFSAKASSDHDGRKGVDILLKVLEQLIPLNLDIHFMLTGPGWDHVIQQSQLENVKISYFSYLPDKLMPVYYNSLDIYLVTSRVEGGPVPPLEAMSCGIPVISTPVGTIRDYVSDGINGLLVPIEDVIATKNAILKLYFDRGLAGRLGSAGRETILGSLQWKDTVSGIDQLYSIEQLPSHRVFHNGDLNRLSKKLIKNDEIRWMKKNNLQVSWIRKMKRVLNRARK